MLDAITINQVYHLLFQQYPDVLNVKEVSFILNVSSKTVYKLLEKGEIQSLKVGREYRIPKLFVFHYLQLVDKL